MNEILKTLTSRGESLYEEKKSSFIGIAVPVSSEQEALEFIKSVRSEYKKARHYVYAYTVYEGDTLISRYSDDGEPQGTGGVPVLGVLESQGIENAAVVVVRYFGGVLLGASGLTRAYRKAAAEAVNAAEAVLKVFYDELFITLDYQSYNAVKYLISAGMRPDMLAMKYKVIDENFSDKIVIHMYIAVSDTAKMCDIIKETTFGRAEMHIDERKGRFDL